jgi:hypothetical protein
MESYQTTQNVWDFLSGIPIGTIAAWVIVICAIIGFLCAVTIKLFKAFDKYREVKDMNEKYKKTLEQQGEQLNNISGKVDKLLDCLEVQRKINYKQVRLSIVRICNEAIDKGEISASQHKSLMEMYDEYTESFADMKPNGYVHQLIDMVNDNDRVVIIGKIVE